MSKKYTYTDFFDDNILSGLDKIDEKISDIHNKISGFGKKASGKDTAGFVKLTQEAEAYGQQVQKVTKTETQAAKERERAAKKGARLQAQANKEADRFNIEAQKKNETLKLQAKRVRDIAAAEVRFAHTQKGSIERIQASNRVLNLKRNTLEIGTKRYDAYTRAILRNETQLKKLDAQVGRSQRHVGAYQRALGGVRNAMISFGMGIMGAAALVQGFIQGVKAALNIMIEFQKDVDKLGSILGDTGQGLDMLRKQAIDLGASTAFSATQIVGLQTELAKLGFNSRQIKNSVKGIQSLSAATGFELPRSAALAGAALNIYGLATTEAGRASDVFALATTRSALTMEKIETMLPIVGTSARVFGDDIETTTAKLGTLADRGIDASTAATSLRMIYSRLAREGRTWDEGMELISNSTNKVATATELFGERAAAAAIILSESGDSVENLTNELNNAKGAADAMAEAMLDNVRGDIILAKSAWEGFVLSIESGNGIISKAIRGTIQSFTQFLTDLKTVSDAITNLSESLKTGLNEQLERLGISGGKAGKVLSGLTKPLRSIINPLRAVWEGVVKLADAINDIVNSGFDNSLKAITERLQEMNKALSTEYQEYFKEEIIRLNYELRNGIITADKYWREITKLQDKFNEISKDELALTPEEELGGGEAADDALANFMELQKIEKEHFDYSVLQRKKHNKDLEYLELDKKHFQLAQQKELFRFMMQNVDNYTESEILAMQNMITAIKMEIDQLSGVDIGGTLLFGKAENALDDFKISVGETRERFVSIWKLEPEEEEALRQKLSEYANMAFAEITRIANQRIELYDKEIDTLNALINKDEERLDRELKSIEEKRTAGVAYNRQTISNLEAEIKKNRELEEAARAQRRTSARNAKRAAIAETIFNTAKGVTRAFGDYAFPYNLIVAGITGAAGAVQIATVKAQEFSKGTEYVDDANAPRGTDTILAKIDRGERIVPKKENAKIPRSFPNYLLADAVNHYLISGAKDTDNNLAELQQQTGLLSKIANEKEVKYNLKGQKVFEKIGNTTNIYS